LRRCPSPGVALRIRICPANTGAADNSSQSNGVSPLSIRVGKIDLDAVATHRSDECNGGSRRVITDAIGNHISWANESVRRAGERCAGLHGYIDVNIRHGVTFCRGCDDRVGPGYSRILGCSATATNAKRFIQVVTSG
jgi:hypothetical protein